MISNYHISLVSRHGVRSHTHITGSHRVKVRAFRYLFQHVQGRGSMYGTWTNTLHMSLIQFGWDSSVSGVRPPPSRVLYLDRWEVRGSRYSGVEEESVVSIVWTDQRRDEGDTEDREIRGDRKKSKTQTPQKGQGAGCCSCKVDQNQLKPTCQSQPSYMFKAASRKSKK